MHLRLRPVDDRLVALTSAPYQGSRRMTLTYPALGRADEILWLVEGEDKRAPLAAPPPRAAPPAGFGRVLPPAPFPREAGGGGGAPLRRGPPLP